MERMLRDRRLPLRTVLNSDLDVSGEDDSNSEFESLKESPLDKDTNNASFMVHSSTNVVLLSTGSTSSSSSSLCTSDMSDDDEDAENNVLTSSSASSTFGQDSFDEDVAVTVADAVLPDENEELPLSNELHEEASLEERKEKMRRWSDAVKQRRSSEQLNIIKSTMNESVEEVVQVAEAVLSTESPNVRSRRGLGGLTAWVPNPMKLFKRRRPPSSPPSSPQVSPRRSLSRPTSNHRQMTRIQRRCQGSLIGLALGDCMGSSVKFCTIQETRRKTVRGPFLAPGAHPLTGSVLAPGTWMDETSLVLCVSASLCEYQGTINAENVILQFKQWRQSGLWSCINFPVGSTAAMRLWFMQHDYREKSDMNVSTLPYDDASVLPRVLPVVLCRILSPTSRDQVCQTADTMCRITHSHPLVRDACRLLSAMLFDAIRHGLARHELVQPSYFDSLWKTSYWTENPPASSIRLLCTTQWRRHPPLSVNQLHVHSVVRVLSIVFRALGTSRTWRGGMRATVNGANDSSSDICGAVFGMLAGASGAGLASIPRSWRRRLQRPEILTQMVENLWNEAVRHSQNME